MNLLEYFYEFKHGPFNFHMLVFYSLSDDEDEEDSYFRVISNFLHLAPNAKTFFFCNSKGSCFGARHNRGSKSNMPPIVSEIKNQDFLDSY